MDYGHLLNMRDLGRIDFLPEGSKTVYVVRDLLEGIETDERREERREDQVDPREKRVWPRFRILVPHCRYGRQAASF